MTSTTHSAPVESSRPVTVDDFVIALHDFAAVSSGSNTCLSFSSGQVIRVLNRDKSGWWDGETVVRDDDPSTTSCRGWFPSNYVATLDSLPEVSFAHSNRRRPSETSILSSDSRRSASRQDCSTSPNVTRSSISAGSDDHSSPTFDRRPSQSGLVSEPSTFGASLASTTLLNPIRDAIERLRDAIQEGHIVVVQPATANLISSVRHLLNITQCLNRDSSILKLHPPLARERRQILSVLGSLVDKARKLTVEHSKTIQDESEETTDHLPESLRDDLADILSSTDTVSRNVNHFWKMIVQLEIPVSSASPTSASFLDTLPDRPLSKSTHRSQQSTSGSIASSSSRSARPSSTTSTRQAPKLLTRPSLTLPARQLRREESFHQSHDSLLSARPSPVLSPYQTPGINGSYTSTEVLDMLEQAHDCVLSTVAVFIGHAHIHSSNAHPSSHAYLIDMTRDVIERVREMLVLVESISKQSVLPVERPNAFTDLATGREALYLATTSLVTAARVATSGPLEDLPTAPADPELNALSTSSTALLRAANECMAAAGQCLQGHPTESGMSFEVIFAEAFATESSAHQLSPTSSTHLNDSMLSPETSIRRPRHTISMLGRKGNSLQCASPSTETDSEDGFSQSPTLTNAIKIKSVSDAWTDSSQTSSTSSTNSTISEDTGPKITPSQTFVTTQRGRSMTSVASDSPKDRSSRRSNSLTSVRTDASRDSSPPTSASPSLTFDPSRIKSNATDVPPTVSRDSSATPMAVCLSEPSHEDWLSSRDYPPEEVSFNPDGHVIGGTLRGLVERMTLHDTPIEAAFSHTFFLTFRMFTTPVEFARALIARFSIELPADRLNASPEEQKKMQVHKIMPIRLRVYNVLKTWLEFHWRSPSDSAALPMIAQWAKTQMLLVLRIPAERFLALVNRRIEESRQINLMSPTGTGGRKMTINGKGENAGTNNWTSTSPPPPPSIISKQLMAQIKASFTIGPNISPMINVMYIDPTELARQITLIESKLYCAISPEEIIGQEFSKKTEGCAMNVRAMSAMSTRMTGWITESILKEEDMRKRSQILKYCIKLGSRLLELQNYNALMSIMSALNSSTITRLKRTWDALNAKTRATQVALNQAVSHHRNYAEYRASLRKAQAPCLPFLGVYLTDITFCHEGNPTHRASPLDPNLKLINFDRYQKMSKIITDLQRFQVQYNLIEVPEIISFITGSLQSLDINEASADTLYRRSLLIEPRESHIQS